MQTLEQELTDVLAEVEPIFKRVEGGFDFTHKAFREVLTASRFAKEINSGKLTVREAYERFWSYKEDAKLWGLPEDQEWRALLPDWQPILLYMISMFDDDKVHEVQEVVGLITKSYFSAKERLSENDYNPFYDDLLFAARVIDATKHKNKIKTERLREELIRLSLKYGEREQIEALAAIADDRIIDVFIRLTKDGSLSSENRDYAAGVFGAIGSEEAVPALIDVAKRYSSRANYYALARIGNAGNEEAISFFTEDVPSVTYTSHCLYIEAMNFIDPQKIHPRLIERLKNRDDPQRERIIRILGAIRSEMAVPALVEYIQDSDNPSRTGAVNTLGWIGSEEAVNALVSIAKEYSDCCEAALLALGNTRRETAFPFLIDYVMDKGNPYRHSAAKALGRLVEVPITKLVYLSEVHADPRYRHHTYKSFTNEAKALARKWADKVVPALVAYLQEETSPPENLDKSVWAEQRDKIAWALGEFRSQEAVPALIQYFRSHITSGYHHDSASNCLPNSFLSDATHALIKTGGEQVVDFFIGLIRDKRDLRQVVTDRQQAIWALGRIGSERAIPALVERMREETDAERNYFALALGEIGSEQAIPALIEYVDDKSKLEKYRHDALYALDEIGSEKCEDFLIRYVDDSTNPNRDRERAAKMLEDIRSRRSVPHVIKAIREVLHPEHLVLNLGEIGSEEAIPFLREYLHDRSNSVRHWAAKSLGKIGGKDAVKVLREFIGDHRIHKPVYESLHSAHQRLKPKGYKAPIAA